MSYYGLITLRLYYANFAAFYSLPFSQFSFRFRDSNFYALFYPPSLLQLARSLDSFQRPL
ncbi:hypothetical protein Gotur_024804 [Gossypium turneri]